MILKANPVSLGLLIWEQIAGENDTILSISNLNQPEASFTSPQVEKGGQAFSFRLTVKDEAGQSSSASCIVNVTWDNKAPLANAGMDQRVSAGENVQLDGSASTDSDGTLISCLWEQTAGEKVELSDALQLSPFFMAPYLYNNEKLVFRLTITDQEGLQSIDFVEIVVTEAGFHNGSDLSSFIFDPAGELNCFIKTLIGSGE